MSQHKSNSGLIVFIIKIESSHGSTNALMTCFQKIMFNLDKIQRCALVENVPFVYYPQPKIRIPQELGVC